MGMPLLMIIACAVGTALVIRRFRNSQDRSGFSFLLLWAFFPLLVTMKPHLVRYDGMRQFYFVLPAIAVFAALGFRRIIAFFSARFPRIRSLGILCMTVLLLSLAHEIVLLHPFEGSYRNEFVRFVLPYDMEKLLQIEYWGATYKQGTDWLIEHAEPNPFICVPTAGALLDWYPLRDDFTMECSKRTNYVMFFTRYSQPAGVDFSSMTPVFTIERMGATLLNIYKL
jgi:hypothetical protein